MKRTKLSSVIVLLVAVAAWVAPWGLLFAQSAHAITVSWTYTQGTDTAVGFNVYRATVSGGPYSKQNAAQLSLSTLSYSDTSGTANTKYYYVIRAVDAIGLESSNSNEASATMLGNPNPPQGVTATAN